MSGSTLTRDSDEPPAFVSRRITLKHATRRTSKTRRVSAPNRAMRTIHQRMVDRLWMSKASPRMIEALKFATGGLPGNNPLGNVLPHRNAKSRYFYLLDLRHAYQSVQPDRLAGVLRDLGLGGVQRNLGTGVDDPLDLWGEAALECYFFDQKEGGLWFGGPASPMLFNLYAGWLIDRQVGAFGGDGWVYTRYFDDLTFSSPRPIMDGLRREIKRVITDAGFEASHPKSSVIDLQKRPVVVTGVGMRRDHTLFFPRRNELIAKVHQHGLTGSKLSQELEGELGMAWAIYKANAPSSTEGRRTWLSYISPADRQLYRAWREMRKRVGKGRRTQSR